LPAGRVIPSEATLSQEYGLSRGTVVKALDALERDGLVRRVQGRGTFVSERQWSVRTFALVFMPLMLPRIWPTPFAQAGRAPGPQSGLAYAAPSVIALT
jgi:DNA-binding transcriptional MocR family regulator